MVAALDNHQRRDVYSVSRLNREVKWLLTDSFPRLWIEGELSNLSRPASGHWYFTLKDDQAQVRCAMFRRHNMTLDFNPENGMQVLVRAQVGLYEPRGEFQLIADTMEEAGDGALRRAFEALKRRLEAEGLFSPEVKRPIPPWPDRIGIITSPTGAAIRDILSVLKRRFPSLEVLVYPCQVQGDAARTEIVQAIEQANHHGQCDVLILARGGGSLEDLWPFNEETVARAIRGSRIPVITGIGHETDFTIADFAADLRAPTPSAAAEAASPDGMALSQRLVSLEGRLQNWMGHHLKQAQRQFLWMNQRLLRLHPTRQLEEKVQRLDELESRLQRAQQGLLINCRHHLDTRRARLHHHHPSAKLHQTSAAVQQLQSRLEQLIDHRLETRKMRLAELGRALDAVSPLATLDRGYAIVCNQEGKVLTRSNQTRPGDEIRIQLAQGRLHCHVKEVHDD